MTGVLTFGDTFTIPATGEDVWRIFDVRPVSYLPPENLTLPGRSLVARARTLSSFAAYDIHDGWRVYETPADIDDVIAQLRALPVSLGHRTDDEWRALHFEDLRRQVEQALSTVDVIGWSRSPLAPHPLVSDAEHIAFFAASAAAEAAKGRAPGLFNAVYTATLARLNA